MTQFELSLSPLLPPTFIVALAIAAALVVALAIYARRPGAFLPRGRVSHILPPHPGAWGLNPPVLVVGAGHEGRRPRRIDVLEAPRFGIVGKDQTIEVRVLDTARQKLPVRLKVSRDGAEIA